MSHGGMRAAAVVAIVWLLGALGGCGGGDDGGTAVDGAGGGPGADAVEAVDAAGGGLEDGGGPGAHDAGGTAGVDVPADVPIDSGGPAGPPWLSRAHRTRVIDLGEHGFDQYGYTENLTLTVPEGYDALFLVTEGEDDVNYVVSSLQSPAGVWIVPRRWDLNGDPTLCLACDNRVSSAEAVGTAMVPSAPPIAVEPGDYLFSVRGYRMRFTSPWANPTFSPAEVPVHIRALLRERLPDGPARLDLNLHFTGAGGVTAANAANHETIKEILATIDAIYAAVDIRIGAVRYSDVAPELAVVETVRGGDDDLGTLFEESAGEAAALDLFFVESISDADNPMGAFGVILGIAGGIPGPPLLRGTRRTGVAVVIEPPAMAGEVSTGNIAAHESGHFLGLYHTTEMSLFGGPSIFDDIEDTPQNDPANLMFYTSTGEDTALTPGQGYVMRRHPLVYAPDWLAPARARAAAPAAAPAASAATAHAASPADPFVALVGATCGAPTRAQLVAAAAGLHPADRLYALALDEAETPWIRQRAVSLLSHFPEGATAERLAALATVGPEAQRALAVYTRARAFGALDPQAALEGLRPHLAAADARVRDRAVRALRWVDHEDAEAALRELEQTAPAAADRRLARHVLARRSATAAR